MTDTPAAPSFEQWRQHAREFALSIDRQCCGKYDQSAQAYTTPPDTGARAALRSGLRKPVEKFGAGAHKCVFNAALDTELEPVRAAWLEPNPSRFDPARERAYYAVAAMIAAQVRDARDQSSTTTASAKPPGGLGWSVAQLDQGESVQEETPREKELRALSRLSLDGIHHALPDLVGHLRSEAKRVDWGQLILDLSAWPYRRDEVTKRWNQDYYRTRYAKEPTASRATAQLPPTDTDIDSDTDQEGQAA